MIDPAPIYDAATAFWKSAVLFAACRLGVFDAMEHAADAAAVAQRLNLSERGTSALLDACVALGLLDKAGDTYRNTPAGDRYLTSRSHESLLVTLELQAGTYPMWMRLSEAVRSGQPVIAPGDLLGDNADLTRKFVVGMHQRALGMAGALDDSLDTWSKPEAIVAKTQDGQPTKVRQWDPDCWLNGDTYYAITGGKDPGLMKSKDLKDWTFLGPLLHDDYPAGLGVPKGEDISCANMFKIGKKWMLLCISHSLGCRYYIGDFKDEKYLPEFHALMSWNGRNFFAPESMLTKDGRRVMWAWLIGMPIEPTGVQSLPRELELPEDGVLRIRPLRELETLRYDPKQEEGTTVRSDAAHNLKEISGDALELEATFKAPSAKEFGMVVRCDKDGTNGMRIAIMAEGRKLAVGTAVAPFELKEGEDLVLRVFVDKSLVEVFANDRQAVAAAFKAAPENLGVSFFSKGGDAVVKQVKGWKMKSIYAGR